MTISVGSNKLTTLAALSGDIEAVLARPSRFGKSLRFGMARPPSASSTASSSTVRLPPIGKSSHRAPVDRAFNTSRYCRSRGDEAHIASERRTNWRDSSRRHLRFGRSVKNEQSRGDGISGHGDAGMLRVIFTLDYEIHGNGEGCPLELMVEPTRRMMDLFERHGAKLTIMADVAEILNFRGDQEQFGRDDCHYDAIAEQLRDAVRRGHDVQLHLHASYFNARRENGRWQQDWSEYNFAGLPLERLNELVRIGKKYLETLLKPVNPRYECIAFRAANWSVSPSRNVVRALVQNGIGIDTSVFKHGRRDGIVSFDYSAAPSEIEPWLVDENDICRRMRRASSWRCRFTASAVGSGHFSRRTGCTAC